MAERTEQDEQSLSRAARLEQLLRAEGVLVAYLFGSRREEGLRYLAGVGVAPGTSDLDVAVLFAPVPARPGRALARLAIGLEELFLPFRVDLLLLDRVDSLLQYEALCGRCIFVADEDAVDRYELQVMRRAEELQRKERRREQDVAEAILDGYRQVG